MRSPLRFGFPSASLSVLLVAPFVCASVLAQPNAQGKQGPDPADTFEDQTSVLEIQIPVNVVDRKGRPVSGLTADDFEILDEGQAQVISGFRTVDLETLEPGPARAADRFDVIPSAARRHFLFLFDLTFSNPTAILKARQAAQEFVTGSMHESDLAAVAIHSVESGPRLIVTFTPDRAQLARAIDTLGAPGLLDNVARDPLRFVIDNPNPDSGLVQNGDQGGQSPLGELEGISTYLGVIGNQMARIERSYELSRVASWSGSMSGVAKILGTIEGRKHVIYFTEGFDGRLLLGRQPDTTDPEAEADYQNVQRGQYHLVDTDQTFGNTLLQKQVNGMLEEFRRADCVLQVVDISGLRADLPAEDRRRRVNDDALFYIANETGGQLHEDANDFVQQLERVLATSNLTYLLSFHPDELGEAGSHHRIKVKLKDRKGVRISHRTGYYAPRPFDELHPLEKGLLASNLITSAEAKNDLDIEVLVAPFRSNVTSAYVPVIIEVQGNSLLIDHEPDQLPVEFYAYVTDEKGEMRDFFTQIVSLDVTSRRTAFANSGVKYYGHLDLAPGNYLVRVLARNAITGRSGVRNVPIEVPQYSDAVPDLLPPFFVEAPGSWFLVKEQNKPGDQGSPYPFTVNGEPYVPSAVPTLRATDSAEICLVAYNFGEGRLIIDSKVLDSEGIPVTGGEFVVTERTITGVTGLDKLTASFKPTGLTGGEYTLEVSVLDPRSQAMELSSIPIRVASEGP